MHPGGVESVPQLSLTMRRDHRRVVLATLASVRAKGKNDLSSRPAAQCVQGVRRQRHLRAQATAQPVQGVRRQRDVRAWAAA